MLTTIFLKPKQNNNKMPFSIISAKPSLFKSQCPVQHYMIVTANSRCYFGTSTDLSPINESLNSVDLWYCYCPTISSGY